MVSLGPPAAAAQDKEQWHAYQYQCHENTCPAYLEDGHDVAGESAGATGRDGGGRWAARSLGGDRGSLGGVGSGDLRLGDGDRPNGHDGGHDSRRGNGG